jgi:hypothetical protein
MQNGFYIFCDESVKKDRFYSNFYGGVLIDKKDFNSVNNVLLSKKLDLLMEDSELKWSNINAYRVKEYCEMIDTFFEFVKLGILKLRIMFTDNRFLPKNITDIHRQNEYHLLYYQFVKHAFGFRYINSDYNVDLELFFDWLPDKKEKNDTFKRFIFGLQFLPEFVNAKLQIKKDSIYEVDSKKHIILQCLDVVLGAMAFRLNHHHKDIPEGSKRRGKRTVAKEIVYKHIHKKICETRANFNIGISTGLDGQEINIFLHSYRHWLFIPKENEKLDQ